MGNKYERKRLEQTLIRVLISLIVASVVSGWPRGDRAYALVLACSLVREDRSWENQMGREEILYPLRRWVLSPGR